VFNELYLSGDRAFTELTPQSPRVGTGGHLRLWEAGAGNGPERASAGSKAGRSVVTLDGRCVVAVTVAGRNSGWRRGAGN